MSRHDAITAEVADVSEASYVAHAESRWATTVTAPYAAGPADQVPMPNPAGRPPAAPATAPAVSPPTWSGRKSAIAAALAIGISAAGAVGAAAALPTGSAQTGPAQTGPGTGQFQRGGFGPGQFPRGPQQLPGQAGQANPNVGTP